MSKAALLQLAVAAMCLVLGVVVGSALDGARPSTGSPDAGLARLADLEAANEQLREELEAARLTIDTLRAGLRGPGPAEGGMAAAAEEVPGAGEPDPRSGARAERMARAKEALPGIEYHLSANPTDRDLLAEYVTTAARAGEYDASIEKLEALLVEHPDNADILAQLGRAYLSKTRITPNLMEQGKLAFTALERFDTALEKHPEHYESRFLRAVTNYNMPPFMNKMDTVVEDFETLVAQGRGSGDADRHANSYVWLARSYQKAGKLEEAKKALATGMGLYPGNERLEAEAERQFGGE
jgi:tetratricopeptide (TPR) repeat protein